MNEQSTFEYLKDKIGNFYDYAERNIIMRIEELNLINQESICYIKNLRIREKEIIFYIFNGDYIYKIQCDENESEIVKFKLFKKEEVKDLNFSISDDRKYSVSFTTSEGIECFTENDVSQSYRGFCNNTIKDIINYFIK